jgi:hypothetical protein
MDWIDLAQDRDQWRVLVNIVVNQRIKKLLALLKPKIQLSCFRSPPWTATCSSSVQSASPSLFEPWSLLKRFVAFLSPSTQIPDMMS